MLKPFDSPKILLHRAYRHITEFERDEMAFIEQQPYRMFAERDPQSGIISFKVGIKWDMPPMLPTILFDAINCMRSSLDHAVFDGSREIGGNPKPKYTKFPFGNGDAETAAKDLARKRSEIPEPLATYLLGFKPFHPDHGGNRALFGLNEIRNGKIHRTLTETIITGHNLGIGASDGGTAYIDNITIERVIEWDREKRELTYMRATTYEAHNTDISFAVRIAFDEGTAFAKQPAANLLRDLHRIVTGIVTGIEMKTAELKLLQSPSPSKGESPPDEDAATKPEVAPTTSK